MPKKIFKIEYSEIINNDILCSESGQTIGRVVGKTDSYLAMDKDGYLYRIFSPETREYFTEVEEPEIK